MALPEKVLVTGATARRKLIKGARMLASTVKETIGPWGTNALIEKGNRVTNDGVTIAREVRLDDEIEHLGARKMQEVASKTNDEAGDGTTGSICLADGILQAAENKLPIEEGVAARMRPIEFINQVEEERKMVTEKLMAMAQPVTSEEQLIEVATVSVEDPELGKLIGSAQWGLGAEGYLLAEETAERVSSVENIAGIRFDNGMGASVMMNNQEKQCLDLSDIHVILTNHIVRDLNPLKGVLDTLTAKGVRQVAIIARAFTDEAIQICLKNTQAGHGIYPINAPYVDQAQIMGDMAAVLGGSFINSEERNLGEIMLTDVGFASKIRAYRYSAVLTGRDDDRTKESIAKRVEILQKKLAGEVSDFEKKNLATRIAQLTNGFGLIKVGAVSETERGYKKDKVDDAVNAVRAALQEGVVPGAGQAYKAIADEMEDTAILKQPLLSIYEQIMKNAPDGYVIPDTIQDPVKVLRIGLEKACSIAATLATTTIAIASKKEKPRLMQEVDNGGDNDED
jgi:chaperonin GroEL